MCSLIFADGRLHQGCGTAARRLEHSRGCLLHLLRYAATGRGCRGEEVWYGEMGSVFYDSLGHLHSLACMGESEMAAHRPENDHWNTGRYAWEHFSCAEQKLMRL